MNTQQDNVVDLKKRISEESKSVLDALVQEGARRMLQTALEQEVAEYIERHVTERDSDGRRQVVRNGSMPERQVMTAAGPLEIKQPRVDDRRSGKRFSSAILPPYMRRSPSLEVLLPVLYLKGISTGDFSEAFEAILGRDAAGLSQTTISRLKQDWSRQYRQWRQRDVSHKKYVYVWADAVYLQVRLSQDRPCMLVLIGATEDGRKEILAIEQGVRESELSWQDLLLDLRRRGLKQLGKLAIADGALGFWQATSKVYPGIAQQRCWVHKTANILDKVPKKIQPQVKKMIHEMYLSDTKSDALQVFEDFVSLYGAKYPRAVECLVKDKEALFAFYDFPAEHWQHLRTTNPIESTFATVRHRTRQTRGCGSVETITSMVFKLALQAEKRWRRLRGYGLIPKVMNGTRFKDGHEVKEKAA